MKRFKNILALVTFETRNSTVVDKAVWLAKTNEARLTLLDAAAQEPGAFARLFGGASEGDGAPVDVGGLDAEMDKARHAALDELAAQCRAAGVETETAMRTGPIFISAIRQVLESEHDLVMKTASSTSDQFFLSDDLHLMRKCPAPVWILQDENAASTDAAIRTVLAAVDPDPTDATRDVLAHTVLTLATSLAERTSASVHVVNAWCLQEESALRNRRINMAEKDIAAILERERMRSESRLNALLDDFPDPARRRIVAHRKGWAGDVVPEYAAEIGADTLVTGTVGRTGLSGFFIGNSAEAILNRVRCSVLTTKPPGFVSPVGLEGG